MHYLSSYKIYENKNTKNVLILISQDGDWEALYINGKIIDQSHTLGEGNSRLYLLEKSEEYSFTSKNVRIKYLSDLDQSNVNDYGSFPDLLSELKDQY